MIIEYNHFEYEQEQQKLTNEKFHVTLTYFKNSNCRKNNVKRQSEKAKKNNVKNKNIYG